MAEHSVLTGTDLHEPKGLSEGFAFDLVCLHLLQIQSANEIYIADGSGSGAWKKSAYGVHGEMLINVNVTPEVTPTAVDTTLSTDSDYTKIITGWSTGHLSEVTFNVDELIVPVSGVYEIHAWADIFCPSNNQRIGIKYAINDSAPYSTRKFIATSAAVSDIINISGSGYAVGLLASDTLSLYIATDKAGDPTVLEAGIIVRLAQEA